MMMTKVYAAFVTSFGVALALASNQAFGQLAGHGGSSASTHSTFHPSFNRSPHHRIGRNVGPFFPAAGGLFWGSSNGLPSVEVAPPISGAVSGDFTYTFKNDVPWDWAHRFPPNFFGPVADPPPAPRISIPSGCPTQAVTVPGTDGKDQTINMVRC